MYNIVIKYVCDHDDNSTFAGGLIIILWQTIDRNIFWAILTIFCVPVLSESSHNPWTVELSINQEQNKD